MKKQLLLILMTLLPMVAWADESGKCGDNLTWTYYESTYSLVITGSGDMYNYAYKNDDGEPKSTAPWNKYCNDMVSVTFPEGLTSIGDYAFWECGGLSSVSIPHSVTSIGDYTFLGCNGLASLTIPNSVTSIGEEAFGACRSMTSVIIPNSVTSIGDGAFSSCSSLTSVTIGNNVTSIGERAFWECSSLTSITIPNSVTSIGSSAFYECSSLTSVTIGNNVTSIGERAFWVCSSLTSVTIPNSVASIGNYAFYYCSSMTSVTIGNGVTSIGGATFYGCSNLTSVTIGNSVKSIASNAFEGCSNLTAVHITDLAAWCNISFDYYNYYYSNPLNYAHHLFLNGEEIKDLVIPNSVTSLNYYVFCNCSSFTSVTIPQSVKNINNSAFYGCSGLTSVTCLNPQPPACDKYAFSDYSVPLYVPQGSTLQYKAAEGWRNFVIIRELNGDDDIYLTINDGAKGNIEIKVDKEKPYFTLRVQPEIGWHIYSVSFNGETVTGEIDSDGTYTTPTINQNSELNIVYAQGASSAPSLENPHIHFTSTENSIVINGTMGGESISVCSLEGKCLAKVVASGYTTEIPLYTHQTYLIKINQSVFKVSM